MCQNLLQFDSKELWVDSNPATHRNDEPPHLDASECAAIDKQFKCRLLVTLFPLQGGSFVPLLSLGALLAILKQVQWATSGKACSMIAACAGPGVYQPRHRFVNQPRNTARHKHVDLLVYKVELLHSCGWRTGWVAYQG